MADAGGSWHQTASSIPVSLKVQPQGILQDLSVQGAWAHSYTAETTLRLASGMSDDARQAEGGEHLHLFIWLQ